jgi:hypothetical protein
MRIRVFLVVLFVMVGVIGAAFAPVVPAAAQPAPIALAFGAGEGLYVATFGPGQPPKAVNIPLGYFGQGEVALLRPHWVGDVLYYSAIPTADSDSLQVISRVRVGPDGPATPEQVVDLGTQEGFAEATSIVATSPDGRYLWAVKYIQTSSVLVDTQAPADQRIVYTLPKCGSNVYAWTPQFLFTQNAFCLEERAFRNPTTGEPIHTFPEDTPRADAWTFVPAAQPFMVGAPSEGNGPIYRFDPVTGKFQEIGQGWGVTAARDGSFILYQRENNDLMRLRFSDGVAEKVGEWPNLTPFWESDGALVAVKAGAPPQIGQGRLLRITADSHTETTFWEGEADQVAAFVGWPSVAVLHGGKVSIYGQKGLVWTSDPATFTPAEKPFGEGRIIPLLGGRWTMFRFLKAGAAAHLAVNVETGQTIALTGELVGVSPDGAWLLDAVVDEADAYADALYAHYLPTGERFAVYNGPLGQRNPNFPPSDYYVWR